MAVRQSYQFNAPNLTNDGGLILQNPADIRGFLSDGVSLPWAVDIFGSPVLVLGDTLAGTRGKVSLPTLVAGGFGIQQRNLTAGVHPITVDDSMLFGVTSGGNVTLQLPSAAAFPGQILWIKKTSPLNQLIIDPAGAETIELRSTWTIFDVNQPLIIRSGGATNWDLLETQPVFETLIENFAPGGGASSGAITDVANSGFFTFNGRATIFDCALSLRNVIGGNELAAADVYIRIDAGPNIRFTRWTTNIANNRQVTSGSVILIPTDGSHNFTIAIQRILGTGAITMDANDFVKLTALEL